MRTIGSIVLVFAAVLSEGTIGTFGEEPARSLDDATEFKINNDISVPSVVVQEFSGERRAAACVFAPRGTVP